jgi:hypothetical protein
VYWRIARTTKKEAKGRQYDKRSKRWRNESGQGMKEKGLE